VGPWGLVDRGDAGRSARPRSDAGPPSLWSEIEDERSTEMHYEYLGAHEWRDLGPTPTSTRSPAGSRASAPRTSGGAAVGPRSGEWVRAGFWSTRTGSTSRVPPAAHRGLAERGPGGRPARDFPSHPGRSRCWLRSMAGSPASLTFIGLLSTPITGRLRSAETVHGPRATPGGEAWNRRNWASVRPHQNSVARRPSGPRASWASAGPGTTRRRGRPLERPIFSGAPSHDPPAGSRWSFTRQGVRSTQDTKHRRATEADDGDRVGCGRLRASKGSEVGFRGPWEGRDSPAASAELWHRRLVNNGGPRIAIARGRGWMAFGSHASASVSGGDRQPLPRSGSSRDLDERHLPSQGGQPSSASGRFG